MYIKRHLLKNLKELILENKQRCEQRNATTRRIQPDYYYFSTPSSNNSSRSHLVNFNNTQSSNPQIDIYFIDPVGKSNISGWTEAKSSLIYYSTFRLERLRIGLENVFYIVYISSSVFFVITNYIFHSYENSAKYLFFFLSTI